jgi:hypothetical protein
MRVILALALLATAFLTTIASADSTAPAMYFHSQVRDAPECSALVNDSGDITYPSVINSPAATCPDAFGWAQFLEAIQAEF